MKICNRDTCPVNGSNACCFYCPEKDECDKACEQIATVCPYSTDDDEMDITVFESQYMTVFKQIKGLVETKKAIEAKEKELKDSLRVAMEAHGIKSVDNDIVKITYVGETLKTSVDSGKLKKRYPAIYEECAKASPVSAYIKIEVKGGEK